MHYPKRLLERGSIEGLVLIAVVVFSILIGGGLFFTNLLNTAPPPNPLAICCDNADCSVVQGRTTTFASPTSLTFPNLKGVPVQYDLLKSNSFIYDCFKHSQDSGQIATYPDGSKHPIIYNTSQELAGGPGECRSPGYDQLADFNPTKHCVQVNDDELIYVCVANCQAPFGNTKSDNSCDPTSQVYGNQTSQFDIYIRDSDYQQTGVPAPIKDCVVTDGLTLTPPPPPPVTGPQPTGNEVNATLQFTPYPSHETLQLHTFDFTQGGQAVGFPRPYCKPAIYLYPPTPEVVTVKINPQGKLNVTIPQYPQHGWHVMANPTGIITYQNQTFDYLYYEAAIPNSLIPSQDTGYVIAYDGLDHFFPTVLHQLGLNTKEQNQFIQYWMKALPYAAYYKISIVPQSVLDQISPLAIIPKPDTLLRVTLNFQPLDTPIFLTPPLLTPIQRAGFTAVEWAGMYQQDKNHPFTCLE